MGQDRNGGRGARGNREVLARAPVP